MFDEANSRKITEIGILITEKTYRNIFSKY